VGWRLDLLRPLRAALDEEVHQLFEALDEILAPPRDAEPGPVAVVWRGEDELVRLVVLRGRHAEDAASPVGARRLRLPGEPALVTVLTQTWTPVRTDGGPGWTLRARGAAPGSLALLVVTSTDAADGPWARAVARSLRYAP